MLRALIIVAILTGGALAQSGSNAPAKNPVGTKPRCSDLAKREIEVNARRDAVIAREADLKQRHEAVIAKINAELERQKKRSAELSHKLK